MNNKRDLKILEYWLQDVDEWTKRQDKKGFVFDSCGGFESFDSVWDTDVDNMLLGQQQAQTVQDKICEML